MSLLSEQKLTPFQENELQWLRKQVDRFQEDKYRTGENNNNVDRNLFVAREELRTFVSNLRQAGKKI
jgi:hypothetical protein|tara:strand:+ start:442 stop:642 length:201 start_codon:yes stop_codon:yes gene_type:complete